MSLSEIIRRPTLLIDRQKCLENIRKMVVKATASGVTFRPHFKTHQSAVIGEWFRNAGVEAITVSSVAMAQYFAANGWEDITIAFPVNGREMSDINRLALSVRLQVLVSSAVSLRMLLDEAISPMGVFIEIDTGAARAGIEPRFVSEIEHIIKSLESGSLLSFAGFLTHAGHTYAAQSPEEILDIHRQSVGQMLGLKQRFALHNPLISVGDTPSCSLAANFEGVDEIRPGNFVFYDLMQVALGSCRPENVAVAVACPVVAVYPYRSEAVIYGGAIHLSRDFILNQEGVRMYGGIAVASGSGWEFLPGTNYVSSLTQEHGVVKIDSNFMKSLKPGDLLLVVPVHACLAAHQASYYLTSDGEFIQKMPPLNP